MLAYRKREAVPQTAGTGRFALSDLCIRNEQKQIVPLVANDVQRKYLAEILPHWDYENGGRLEMRNLREIILKARKQGFSTLVAALFFLDTINNPNTYSVVLAHDTDSTVNLFEIVKTFFKHLPEDRRPRPQYASRREFYWPDLNSRFYVGTAGTESFGRGQTLNNVHGSEVASWPNGETIAAGLLQAVPSGGNVFLESTAEGVGNFYYAEYQKARGGQNNLKPRFFGWFESEKYATPAPPDFVPAREEAVLQLRHNLSLDQLNWRREKRREPQMDVKFVQEFPATIDEAFIASGTPYFNNVRLSDIADALKSDEFAPLSTLEVLSSRSKEFEMLRLELERNIGRIGAPATLRVWELPQDGKAYIISADVSEGLDDNGSHTFDSADVWDAESGVQVAHLHGMWDTRDYGLLLAQIGFWFNTALLGVERNNHGHAVINTLLFEAHYPEAFDDRSGLYLHQEFDEYKKIKTRLRGWPTNRATRVFALDTLATMLGDNEIRPRAPETISEMMKFVKKPGGKSGGQGKSRDDRVMSAAIGAALLKLRPRLEDSPVAMSSSFRTLR